MKSIKKQKQKQKNFFFIFYEMSVEPNWLVYFWAGVKKILPSPKSKINFSSVQFKLTTLKRLLIHLNDGELVIGT